MLRRVRTTKLFISVGDLKAKSSSVGDNEATRPSFRPCPQFFNVIASFASILIQANLNCSFHCLAVPAYVGVNWDIFYLSLFSHFCHILLTDVTWHLQKLLKRSLGSDAGLMYRRARPKVCFNSETVFASRWSHDTPLRSQSCPYVGLFRISLPVYSPRGACASCREFAVSQVAAAKKSIELLPSVPLLAPSRAWKIFFPGCIHFMLVFITSCC